MVASVMRKCECYRSQDRTEFDHAPLASCTRLTCERTSLFLKASELTVNVRVKTRIQASHADRDPAERLAVLPLLLRILKREGVAGYYRGFAATMLNTFSMRASSPAPSPTPYPAYPVLREQNTRISSSTPSSGPRTSSAPPPSSRRARRRRH